MKSLVCLILVVAFAPGCAVLDPKAAPADKVAQLEQSYNVAMRVLVLARLKGLIDDDLYTKIEQVRETADAALSSLKADAAAGKSLDDSAAFRAFNRALDDLILQAQKFQGQVRAYGPSNDLGDSPGRTDLGLYLGRREPAVPARAERRAA